MERKRRGRPKSKEPIRDKMMSFRLSVNELEKAQAISDKYDIRYIDIFLKGLEVWSKQK